MRSKINIGRVVAVTALIVGFLIIGFALGKLYPETTLDEITTPFQKRTLDKYAIPALKASVIEAGTLSLDEFESAENYQRAGFTFEFKPDITGENKISTGEVRVPKETGKYPIIIMLRGYVDQSIYETGVGTRNGSIYFSQNGYITLAPDFLGYGGSDTQVGDIFEARFQTYTLTLALIETVNKEQLPKTILDNWDGKVFIWAHSNGGQIALTSLEVVDQQIPTVLWAPVSKPFPYSVLYYTDESEDQGRYIRKQLAKFEQRYNANLYSLENYLAEITSPILLQQGTADDAVPLAWTTGLYNRLTSLDKQVEIKTYPNADHNMRPEWDSAISDALLFFNKYKDLK